MSIDLTHLRVGTRVKLRGPANDNGPLKPWPIGWHTVAETNGKPSMLRLATALRVESDDRWLPVELIEEIAP